jgi:sirohydrochlorin cobaltochelatase
MTHPMATLPSEETGLPQAAPAPRVDRPSPAPGKEPPEGILLFAHGARDPQWALPFQAVLAQVRERRPEAEVRLAFLELMSPDLAVTGDELAALGCQLVTIVPLFLGAGGHVRRDLPALASALAARHPGLQVRVAAAVGEAPIVISALAACAAHPRMPGEPDGATRPTPMP